MISLLLSVCVILLWRRTVTLRRRLDRLEAAGTREREPDVREPAAAIPPAMAPAPVPVAPLTPDIRAPLTPATSGARRATVADRAIPVTEPPASAQGWEVVVGSSWLNKAGVLIFVTGLALLLGYSMAHVGPLGRVAMGFGIAVTGSWPADGPASTSRRSRCACFRPRG